MSSSDQFLELRNALIAYGPGATASPPPIAWPEGSPFNWVTDYFDQISLDNDSPALKVVDDAGGAETRSFAQLSRRARQVGNFLSSLGVARGDRVMVMLGNVVPLWETMLACIRMGAVMVPTSTLVQGADLQDRIERGRIRAVVASRDQLERFEAPWAPPIRVGLGLAGKDETRGWTAFEASHAAPDSDQVRARTSSSELLLLYFTSGTTARPKLVAHTHASYPVGHLSTMYWIGLRPGDVHLNLSSAGWAKHAWSSFFAPWNAGATIVAYNYDRFSAPALLDQLVRHSVTSLCAPPTVWRMLLQEELQRWPVSLRTVVSAGEPLNPEVIQRVRNAWGVTVRDGFGQTETTAQVGNPPSQPIMPGSMGRPLPGYDVVLLSPDGVVGNEGEICLSLDPRPVGLMREYLGDEERTAEVFRDGYYHTGDVATRSADGYLTYVGRMDDVFKSSDYRISPFELESVLIEHDVVAEAAVVPSPDRLRLAVPKAFVLLSAGAIPDAATARSILAHVRARVSPFKRIRRIEFAELPKTISGKIRRVDLRLAESQRPLTGERRAVEFWEEDFIDLER